MIEPVSVPIILDVDLSVESFDVEVVADDAFPGVAIFPTAIRIMQDGDIDIAMFSSLVIREQSGTHILYYIETLSASQEVRVTAYQLTALGS